MIYALEWYNLRKNKHSELIEFHPYLTVGDFNRLSMLNFEQSATTGVTLLLTSLIANRHLIH